METVPAGIATEAKKGVDAFRQVVREYEEAQARHGLLVPPSTVAESLGVSPQRVDQLMDAGRLRGVVVSGRKYVVAASVVEYLKDGPRPIGRPRKLSKVANSVRLGVELAAAAEAMIEKP